MRAPDPTAISSPAAAAAPGERKRNRFGREIAAVLVVKAAAIAILWLAFFSSPPDPPGGMDPQRVAEHIAAPSPPSAQGRSEARIGPPREAQREAQ